MQDGVLKESNNRVLVLSVPSHLGQMIGIIDTVQIYDREFSGKSQIRT